MLQTAALTKGNPRKMSTKASQQRHMVALRNFSAGLLVLGEVAPERMTLSQSAFFLMAAMADATGRKSTYTEIKEAVGPALHRSLHTTYRVLLDEGRNTAKGREPGLGWLRRETDPSDNRRKYLRLTAKGRRVLDQLGLALDAAAPN